MSEYERKGRQRVNERRDGEMGKDRERGRGTGKGEGETDLSTYPLPELLRRVVHEELPADHDDFRPVRHQ